MVDFMVVALPTRVLGCRQALRWKVSCTSAFKGSLGQNDADRMIEDQYKAQYIHRGLCLLASALLVELTSPPVLSCFNPASRERGTAL